MVGDFEDLVGRVRDHYLEQFWELADQVSKQCTVGTAELKLGLNGQSELYKNCYCVDYATSDDGKIGVVEFAVDRFLLFDPVTFDCGRATLLVDHLRWDDVLIEHDLPDVPADAIEEWFEHWFDPDDAAMRQTEIIHSLSLRPVGSVWTWARRPLKRCTACSGCWSTPGRGLCESPPAKPSPRTSSSAFPRPARSRCGASSPRRSGRGRRVWRGRRCRGAGRRWRPNRGRSRRPARGWSCSR